jgi:alpha-tubulin suppressor-like RCC1 family protein
MPNQFLSPEGDLENYFVSEYWLIDQYIGDELWGWGRTNTGQLGVNNTNTKTVPVTTFAGGTNWKQISGGYGHTAAIKTDGTLWTWGNNGSGQVGANDATTRQTPVTTFIGGNTWKQVSSGNSHTAAIKTDGTLWIWGSGTNGQLGNNDSTAHRSTPVTTFAGGTNWKQISGGFACTSAIKTDGTLWTWGRNNYGQLGTNDTTQRNTPVTTFLGGNTWKQLSCIGGETLLAIKTDGTLWTWGRNTVGQLGVNDTTNRSTPVTTFLGGTNWKQVSGGNFHNAAIKTDGTLWTWGTGTSGQLGNNDSTANRNTPVTTFAGGTNWKRVSVTLGSHTAAIKTDGTLWTWGNNNFSQLGTNDTTLRSTPVTTFAGGTNWKQVSGGNQYTAAVTIGISPELPLS